jgi:RNA polymerase sigma-70 factor (sigma-E family)
VTFEEYLAEHLARLTYFAGVLTGDRARAEDVLQTVLVRAYEQCDRVQAADSPHAYVRRMLVNEHLSWFRKWGRVVPLPELDELMPASADHAEGHAVQAELITLVRRLPPRQRATVVLRYYEELDDDEIASVLGCGVSTVRSNMARALATLRVGHLAACD